MASMEGKEKSCAPQSKGSKQIKCERLQSIASPASPGPAPVGRIYTNDYSKKQESKDRDMVGPFLGNPLRW